MGLIYGGSPFAFLVFIRFTGGVDYVNFYASALGQIVQVLVLVTGLATWWLTGKVARRGIYLTDRGDAPTLNADVHRTGFQKTTVTV